MRGTTTLAKLTRARLHNAVARERLFAQLDKAREHKPAICVVGPPGSGKTTLVASWLDRRNLKGLSFQVDPGDADLATFFHYLGEASKTFTRKGQRPLPALTPEYLHDVPGFSRRFFRQLFARLPGGATLVLDNYQEVQAHHEFHRLIADAVHEIPRGFTLIVVSRRDPPDCYARLIEVAQDRCDVRGDLRRLDAAVQARGGNPPLGADELTPSLTRALNGDELY